MPVGGVDPRRRRFVCRRPPPASSGKPRRPQGGGSGTEIGGYRITDNAVIVKDSLAQIAPADTAIGPPTATARRLVDASVSANTRRAYAALEPISTWTL